MRCLLDKVTARHIMEGMLKLIEGRGVTSTELFALYFYQRASPRRHYVVYPSTDA